METITITLNAEEQAVMNKLIDISLRHLGVEALDVALHFRMKMAQAHTENKVEDKKTK